LWPHDIGPLGTGHLGPTKFIPDSPRNL